MRPGDLLVDRHEHLEAAEKLIKAARNSAKDLSGNELSEYEQHVAEIKKIDATLDRLDKDRAFPITRDRTMPGGPRMMDEPPRFNIGALWGRQDARANGNGEVWADPRTGQPIPILKPEQRMSDLIVAHGEPLSFVKYLRGLVTSRWDGAPRELEAAMSEGGGGTGQYIVPSPLSTQIIDKVRNASVMIRAGSRTVPMEAATLNMARIATDVTPVWHAENAAITASDMTFERVTFTAQTLAAIATLSVELFEDSVIDSVVSDAIAKVLAIELDRACLRGSGTAPEPKGIRNQSNVVTDNTTFTTNGSVISTSAPTGAVAWDWVAKQVSALWGVNENPNAAIYSARTAGELDLLRATTGEVLPPPGSVSKLQLLYTNSIPNNLTQGTNSDCSEAIIGDFSQALIGMRTQLVLEISRQASVGATSMFSTMGVAIRAYMRADLQLARPGAFRVVTGIR